ncbi:MAG: IgA Peptidase M64 [Bacteroides sp.]|nr:IgA Peptidase M64 [Roseburia sp.]MCM1346342.1 IgA Peptidase M64 [Bacteroides sp.]MCM1420277.1 IgA Peptidase M64 [Bacteroides sp.]
MKKFLLAAIAAIATGSAEAQKFDDYFKNKTLRLDYIFAGDSASQAIYFEQAFSMPQWAGRKDRLSEKFLNGNGQITVRDHKNGDIIYVHTFSTLFQEWQTTEEATKVRKAFETSYIVPFPKQAVDVTVTLTDVHNKVSSELTHTIDPTDILIRPTGENGIPFKYIMKNGDIDNCVDIAIVAEGYTEADMEKFYKDAQRATDAIFGHEPFKSMQSRFNVVAVASPSQDGGPCIPHEGKWTRSATNSHYDTFYSDRYLMTSDIHKVYDILSGVPFEHIIVLVNSATYGGGGIYNQITLSTSDHPTFKQVLVHEFGHSYGGLGDEYYYDDQYSTMYPADTEPWEPNLTTLVDFNSKWADLVPKKTPIPTPPANIPNFKTIKPDDKKGWKAINAATQVVGVFEGGGYQTKGVFRPAQECRMKINEVEEFCPVCSRAIVRITDFYTAH